MRRGALYKTAVAAQQSAAMIIICLVFFFVDVVVLFALAATARLARAGAQRMDGGCARM